MFPKYSWDLIDEKFDWRYDSIAKAYWVKGAIIVFYHRQTKIWVCCEMSRILATKILNDAEGTEHTKHSWTSFYEQHKKHAKNGGYSLEHREFCEVLEKELAEQI